jgi:hypothetical protein
MSPRARNGEIRRRHDVGTTKNATTNGGTIPTAKGRWLRVIDVALD